MGSHKLSMYIVGPVRVIFHLGSETVDPITAWMSDTGATDHQGVSWGVVLLRGSNRRCCDASRDDCRDPGTVAKLMILEGGWELSVVVFRIGMLQLSPG
ncbi:hypothetical protein DSO57_1030516 [Entomophthora muscae]|uniref:Uncharacterized protein n=1 Tax=Entomophthora muscae TaxID=34485 RepID=A0ACC2UM60_9FUNG|nr:hypothetical protein DSO57_1030516 [Entomophthora muscae]